MQNSKTGNGPKNTVSRGLKALFRWIGGKSHELTIRALTERDDHVPTGFYIVDGVNLVAGPYAREQDAKGQLTRLLKGYTPASRRPL